MPHSSGRCKIGDANVLSTTVIAPCARPTRATASMSTTFNVGFVGVSAQIICGLHAFAARSSAAVSLISTKTTLSPCER